MKREYIARRYIELSDRRFRRARYEYYNIVAALERAGSASFKIKQGKLCNCEVSNFEQSINKSH